MQHNAQGIVLHLFPESEIPLILVTLSPTNLNQFCDVT